MPRQTIDYSTLPDVERQQKAITDIVNYLGQDKMDQINAAVKADKTITRRNFVIQLSLFVGIDGYPSEVWADQLGLPTYYASGDTNPAHDPVEVK